MTTSDQLVDYHEGEARIRPEDGLSRSEIKIFLHLEASSPNAESELSSRQLAFKLNLIP